MKPLYYSCSVLCLLLLFAQSCRHNKVEVKGVVKQKPAPAKPPAGKGHAPPPPVNSDAQWQQKLGLSTKQVHDSKLYSFINEWYGVPYKYGGCQKSGVDCSCFTNLLCEKVYNAKIPRSAGEMYAGCNKISLEDAREGDLFFFKIGSSNVSHVGVYLKGKLFVHSSTSKGVIINSVDEAYYKKYFFCAGRIKKDPS